MKTNPIDALNLWNRVILRSMHELPHDLSTRQMAIMLTVYLVPPPHSVRSLSEQLRISKPAICRALDVLSSLDLVRRKKDEEDRRNVLIQRTVAGSVFLRETADIIAAEVNTLPNTITAPTPLLKRADVA